MVLSNEAIFSNFHRMGSIRAPTLASTVARIEYGRTESSRSNLDWPLQRIAVFDKGALMIH
jgi:hypothetical protein